MSTGRKHLAAILAALVVTVSTPAAAFELFGLRLFERDKEDAAGDVVGDPQNYDVEVRISGADKNVDEALNGASLLIAEKDRPAPGAAVLIARARADYRRLLAALYTQGHYGGSISILIEGVEAARIALDAGLPDPAKVLISVDPGPKFRFGRAEIVNRAPETADPDDFAALPEDNGFAPGEVARSGTIKRAERLALEAWRRQGHAKAKVSERRIEAAHNQNLLNAILMLRPGRKAYYGSVTVEGSKRMAPEFIAYMAGLPEGGEYDPDDIRRAEERLARLGVFSTARAKEADNIGPGGALPVSFIVRERSARRSGVGATLSTVDGAGIEAFWRHRNLFGRAEQLKLQATIANIGDSLDPDALTDRVAFTFVKPGVFVPDTDFTASVAGTRETLEPYRRNAVAGQAGFTHILSKDLAARIMLTAEQARFTDPAFGRREFTTAGIRGGVTRDSRDDKKNATGGYYADVEMEPFHEFRFANTAVRGTIEARIYRAFDVQKRFVAAGRLKTGFLAGSPVAQTPPDKLFFAGGGGSVRGYAYRKIGVATPDGVTGGRSLVEGSAEIRIRIGEAFGAVAFIDFGNVGTDTFLDFARRTKIGVGAGVRYHTGLGPIRLDVAVPLDKSAGDSDFAVYVGIGQAF